GPSTFDPYQSRRAGRWTVPWLLARLTLKRSRACGTAHQPASFVLQAAGRPASTSRFLQRAARLIVPFSLIRDLPDGLFDTPNDRRERGVVEMLRRVLAHGCADSDLASTSSAATPLPLSLAPGVPERSRWAFSYDTLGQVTSGKR